MQSRSAIAELFSRSAGKNYIATLLPLLVLVWGCFSLHLYGPFYLSRIDPEYAYLINGLNCALLQFDRIGHIDHPGTPFQLFTGLSIQLTYALSGQADLVRDVFSRPEHYLTWASVHLTFITAAVMLWLGRIPLRRGDRPIAALLLQSPLFISEILIDVQARYIPDRMQAVLIFILCGVCVRYLYDAGQKYRSLPWQCGILVGMLLATKISSLPFLLLPLVIIRGWKGRAIFAGSLALSWFVFVLPVVGKLGDHWSFLGNVISHDGLYGGGAEQMIRWEALWYNLYDMLQGNPGFFTVLGLAFISLAWLCSGKGPRAGRRKELLLLAALLAVALAGIAVTAKHYKNYYVIPMVSLSGLLLFVVWSLHRKRLIYAGAIAGLLMLLFTALSLHSRWQVYGHHLRWKAEATRTADFIRSYITAGEYVFIDPSWKGGFVQETGLIYGWVYTHHKHLYYNDIEAICPNLIAWVRRENPLRYAVIMDVDHEALLKSGKSIYYFDDPARHTREIYSHLDSLAGDAGVTLSYDTVYINRFTGEHIIRIGNREGWHTVADVRCGFEQSDGALLYSDDRQFAFSGAPFRPDSSRAINGMYSLRLDGAYRRGPEIVLDSVSAGDYIEITVKVRPDATGNPGRLLLRSVNPGPDSALSGQTQTLGRISRDWHLMRLSGRITHRPAEGRLVCYLEYSGSNVLNADDLRLRHFSKAGNTSPETE